VGSSQNVDERLARHNQNRERATKNKGSWVLEFVQEYSTIKEARQAEYKLKKLKSRDILEKIIENQKLTIK